MKSSRIHMFSRSAVLFLASTITMFSIISCGDEESGPDTPKPTTGIVIPDKEGMTVKGIVIESGTRKPLEGVVVSDGRLCTVTDADGIYYLPTDLKTQRFVFVVTPGDYDIPFSSSNCYNAYKKISGNKVQEMKFALTPRKQSADRFLMLFSGDPQVRNQNGDYASLQFVSEDLRKWTSTITDMPVYKTELGDLAYNDHTQYDNYKRHIAMSGVKTFNVPGNHDHTQDYIGEYAAITDYLNALGPNNYSTNIGRIHFVFLDSEAWGNIPLDEQVDKNYYREGFDEEAISFLENDLKYVPKDRRVMICCHIPMTKTKLGGGYRTTLMNSKRMHDAIAGRKVDMWYGHWHANFFWSYTDSELISRTSAASLESHTVVRCDGALGTNRSLAKDGTPRGVVACLVDGDKVSWTYHSSESDVPDNMWVYTPAMTGDGYVYANPYLWDNLWGTPEWYENGKKVADMELLEPGTGVMDPMYAKYLAEKWNGIGDKPTDTDNSHLFRVTPSAGVKSGTVKVKDRFGNIYETAVTW